jgi:exodeoxyribonuclease V alpha subunit
MIVNCTLQVTSVWPGSIGGAIFKGSVVGERKAITCKASYKIMTRPPNAGEFWTVIGHLTNHSDYGQQLQLSSCHLSHLPSANYVSSLLAKHPAFRGFHLGRAKIKKLMDLIGSDALITLLNEGKVQVLSDVINPAIAEKMVSSWQLLKNEIDTINFLNEHKFDAALSQKVIKLCKKNTVERLKINPYALVCFGSITRNIWRTLERVARKLKIKKDDDRRLVGGIEHVMYSRLQMGHTAITKQDLVLQATEILGSEVLSLEGVVAALRCKAVCVVELSSGVQLIQSVGPAYIEQSLERRLMRLEHGTMQSSLLQSNHIHLRFLLDRYAVEFEREHNFRLSVKQLEAIELGLTTRCAVISGFGGTGKTTVQRAITDLANQTNRSFYLMALSGKAKERMAEATGQFAMTIHAFIKAVKEGSKYIDIHSDPLLIVDEASMVDLPLFNKLLTLFDDLPFSLLTIGDTAQLSPVGFGVVWHRMALSEHIHKVHLTEVHRQAANSPIHHAAMQIRDGEEHTIQAWNGETQGLFLVDSDSFNFLFNLQKLKKSIPEAQVLTPHMSMRMPDSGHKINKYLQEQLCPEARKGVKLGATQIYENDPVIITDNSYELGLFNGTAGTLTALVVNSIGRQCGVFKFDNIEDSVELTADQMFEVGLQLAYAITVHKSQGSEYEATIICCITNSPFLERSLLYTAITRAKRLVLVVGIQEYYASALKRQPRAETLCVGIEL